MTVTHITGDPERLKTAIDEILALGNRIYLLQKTKNNADFVIIYGV